MTDLIFFDTDCISAFLWVNEENLLAQMYQGRIIIPKEVYDELSYPTISHLKIKLDVLISNKVARIECIDITSQEYVLYRKLTTRFVDNNKIIGKGEAAAISLAKKHCGILASNNLKDINTYISEFSLKHMTTGDILVEAFENNLITEHQGNAIWTSMINRKRKLGANSFTEYLSKYK